MFRLPKPNTFHWFLSLGVLAAQLTSLSPWYPSTSLNAGRLTAQEAAFRVAVIGLARPSATNDAARLRALDQLAAQALARDSRVTLIDPELIQAALAGIGYDGSINMSTEEARRLGAAVGCDFFITGKAEALTRSERAGESHEEVIIGVMIIDGRSGRLISFDFVAERGPTAEAAVSAAAKALEARAAGYADRMFKHRAAVGELKRSAPKPGPGVGSSAGSASGGSRGDERLEDLPDEGSPRAVGLIPPEFLSRVRPEYPEQAARADISATVEARVVLKASGQIGEIEITRWAGYGLEEAAINAIRQLKFKPATRDEKPISVRATLRYNFRRVGSR